MTSKIAKLSIALGVFALAMTQSVFAENYSEADYKKKVATNEYFVGVVASVVNGLCPHILVDKAGCNPKDPVGTAVGIQNTMHVGLKVPGDKYADIYEVIDDAAQREKVAKVVTNVDGSVQFYIAVENFKNFLDYSGRAKKAAGKKDWKEATIAEEQAWQYIVKTAREATFAAKMLGADDVYKAVMDLAADK